MNILTFLAILSVMPAADVDTRTITNSLPSKAEQAGVVPLPVPRPIQLALLAVPPTVPNQTVGSITCKPGARVQVPDGREGEVTSFDGSVCRVLAYGEAYVSLWQDDMLELVYPQKLQNYNFGH